MIVDDIENHAESEAMRGVDQGPEIVWIAIEPSGRKQIDAVVAPPKSAGEVGDRHDLENGDAKIGELGQLGDGRPIGAFLGERADMHFIERVAGRLHADPSLIGPDKCVGVDDLGGTNRPLRLKPGCRIRQ